MIQLILSKNPNLKATDINGRDPIYLAVEQGNVKLFNDILNSNEIDIHQTYNESEQNLLHLACQVVCYDIVMTLLDEHDFLPDEPDKNGNTPLFYAVAYTKYDYEEDEENDEEEERDKDLANKDKIITELILRGCDPSQSNRNGRCPFTIADQRTMVVIGKAMEDPKYSEALNERKNYWNRIREEETRERYETKKLETKRLNDFDNSRSRQLSKMTKKERAKREEQLSIMIARGGTLRNGAPKVVPKESNIRPWGGSAETYEFQKEIRTKLRDMNRDLRDKINKLYEQINELRDSVIEPEDNQTNEENNEFDSNPGEFTNETDDANKCDE